MQSASAPIHVIHQESDVVDAKLASLGLSLTALEDVLKKGAYAHKECTQFHPPTYPGSAQWATTVAALRESTAPSGWTYHNPSNLPITISPDNSFCVVVYTGDTDTGKPNGFPTNKAAKGPKAQEAILKNRLTYDLFPEALPAEQEDIDHLTTWVLLYHLDKTNQSEPILRAELSLPWQIDNGKVAVWKERIILKPIELDDIPNLDITGDLPPEPPLDIPIRRRS